MPPIGVDLLQTPGVLAVGVGRKRVGITQTDEPCVKAFVARKRPPAELRADWIVPPVLVDRGIVARTDVDEIGRPTAPASGAVPRSPGAMAFSAGHRPFLGGDSISHYFGVPGTLSDVVRDLTDGSRRLLSCNHVLARLNRALPGDAIVQPATADGGTLLDRCGALLRWTTVWFGGVAANRVDAALAVLDAGVLGLEGVQFVGRPTGARSGALLRPGDPVFRVGRTTGLVQSTVEAVSVTGWIDYPPAWGGLGPALFTDQVVTSGSAAFGDSGALLLDDRRRVRGLLFAGSATHTFYNDIAHVEQELGISVV